MCRGESHLACLALVFLAIQPPAACQSYRFTKVLDGQTRRPDGLGVFYIGFANTTPAFDGKWMVFRDPGPQNDDGSHAAIWSFNTQDSTLHKLVDFNTAVPGGGARFNNIQLADTAPAVRNGVVVFVARDTTARQGLYWVPAAGGPVTKIADQNTADPSGGTFTVFDNYGKQAGAFSFDGTTLAFNANGSTLTVGNYSAAADGSSLGLVADSLHPYTAQNNRALVFSSPVISGSKVAMIGSDGAINSAGYNGIYLGTVGGNGAVTELLNSNQQLPGNPNSNFHTRFDAPVLAFDGTLVAFHATDSNSGSAANPAGWFGLYHTDLTSRSINLIADVNSTLTGLGRLTAIAINGVAVSQGWVLFKAADSTGKSALYLWKNGTATRIIGTGDTLDGLAVQGIAADSGPGSLYGSGFAFNVDLPRDRALYVATPSVGAGNTLTSVSAASYLSGGSLAPGAIASGYGQALASAEEGATSQPLPTALANTTVKVKDSAGAERQAPLFYVGPLQINYIVPEGAALGPAAVTVTSAGQVTATGALNIEAVAPGLFTANWDGRGAPAGAAVTLAPDLTQTIQAIARCGTAQGSCVTSPIDLGPGGTLVVLTLYGTGIRGRSSLAGVSAKFGGLDAQVQYAGAQSQFAGLDQLNIAIPRALAGQGEVDLALTVDAKAANTVRVNIK